MKQSIHTWSYGGLRLVLIVVVSIVVWEAVRTVPEAEAQKSLLPNSAEQRQEMIKQLKANNTKLDTLVEQVQQISKHLESGDMEVQTK